MKKCAVIGSINMDMVLSVPRFPQAGETLMGDQFKTVPGGKGANQAVALARLGADVSMAGCVGEDAFGERYFMHFKDSGVNIDAVEKVRDCATGVADILVNREGENCIVVAAGANGQCDLPWLERALAKTADCEIFLLQLEIPISTVTECIRRLHAAGKTVILDPAPAVPLPDSVLAMADILTPNETELKIITPSLPESASAQDRIRRLLENGSRAVIHKCGSEGAYIGTQDGISHAAGFSVKAVDTTAAGDTFNAGLAAGLAQGMPLEASVRLANAAAALSVTSFGAQDGMPTMAQAEALMQK